MDMDRIVLFKPSQNLVYLFSLYVDVNGHIFFIIQWNILLITKYFDFSLFLICLKYEGFYAISCLPRK